VHSVHLQYTLSRQARTERVAHPLMDLLQAVAEHGSISAAARAMGLSYRHVWGELKRWEQELGHELIVWEKGQSARLSPFGTKLMWAEHQAQARISPHIQALRAELERSFAVAFDPQAHVLTLYASHDHALTRLQEMTALQGLHLDVRFCGSVDAIRALNEGRCVMAGFHSRAHPPKASITASHYRPLLQPGLHKVMGFAQRQMGLMVATGNPLGLLGLHQVVQTQARFARRAQGTGTEVLLQELLAEQGLTAQQLHSLPFEEPSHSAVAATVAAGQADVGLGLAWAAQQQGLDFVPLAQEHYHLVCLKSALDSPAVLALRQFLATPEWRQQLAAWVGYGDDQGGQVQSLRALFPWWDLRPRRPNTARPR
jgi:putative molybdopterin biosynthesis protein